MKVYARRPCRARVIGNRRQRPRLTSGRRRDDLERRFDSIAAAVETRGARIRLSITFPGIAPAVVKGGSPPLAKYIRSNLSESEASL